MLQSGLCPACKNGPYRWRDPREYWLRRKDFTSFFNPCWRVCAHRSAHLAICHANRLAYTRGAGQSQLSDVRRKGSLYSPREPLYGSFPPNHKFATHEERLDERRIERSVPAKGL